MLRRVFGYAAYMFGANSVAALLNFSVSALGMVTRPKAAFGDYATYMLIYGIGSGIFIFGMNAAIQKFAADQPLNRIRFAKLAYLGFGVLFLIFASAGILLNPYYGTTTSLALLGLPFVVFWWWGRYLARSTLSPRIEATLMVLASASNTVLQFVFLTFTDLRDALIYGDFLALVLSGVATFFVLPKTAGAGFRSILRESVPRAFLKEVFSFAAPLWWAGQVFSAKHQIGGVWTSARLGSKAMGDWQASLTLWQFAGKPIEYIGQAALPSLVVAQEDRDQLYRELLRLCLVALPVVGILVAGGVPIVLLGIDQFAEFFGSAGSGLVKRYIEVPGLLLVMALGTPVTALEMVTNQYSVAIGRPRVVLYAQIANVVVMILSLVPLAEQYGVFGVIFSRVLGESVNALTFVVVLWKEKRGSMGSALFWTASTAVASALCLLFVSLFDWAPRPLAAVAGVVAYMLALLGLRIISLHDFVRLKRAYDHRRG